MNIDRFVHRHWFALTLVAVHTLLIGAYAWIELDHAWNDMNPTMLVMAALHVADYPLLQLLQPIFHNVDRPGTFLAVLLVLGGAYWFALGMLVTCACRGVRNLFISSRPVANGV